MKTASILAAAGLSVLSCSCSTLPLEGQAPGSGRKTSPESVESLKPTVESTVQPGDLIFIRIPNYLFRQVEGVQGEWPTHVGIIFQDPAGGFRVAESTFPVSKYTTLGDFLHRTEDGTVAIARLKKPLTPAELEKVRAAAEARFGIFYDLGFNLDSRKQYCSRFVRESFMEGAGRDLGEVVRFGSMVGKAPEKVRAFWKRWFFGSIPMERRTVTPASQLHDPDLAVIFRSGVAMPVKSGG